MTPDLTPRERQIAALVVTGATNAEIGRRLFLSENTIKTAVRKILAKAGARTRTELAVLLVRESPAAADVLAPIRALADSARRTNSTWVAVSRLRKALEEAEAAS